MDILKQIDEQAKMLKKLGFEVHATQAFNDMFQADFAYRFCDTHTIQYPQHLHLSNYCCLVKNDEQCKYIIRICIGGLPEEVIKSLELLGYILNDDVLIYESVKHDVAGNTE